MILNLFNILSSGGDTNIVLLLLKYINYILINHPTDCGFIAFTKNKTISKLYNYTLR